MKPAVHSNQPTILSLVDPMKAKRISIKRAGAILVLALASSVFPSCLSEHQALGILDQSVKGAAVSAIYQSDPIFGRGASYGGGYGDYYGSGSYGGGYGGASGSTGYPGAGGAGGSGEMFEDPSTGAVYQRVR